MNNTRTLPSAIQPSLNRTHNPSDAMTHPQLIQRLFLLVTMLMSAIGANAYAQQDSKAGKADKAKAALTVQVVQAQRADWPLQLRASGNIEIGRAHV